ncbi:MAG TPA: NFACT RNA binding domain-containing protein [Myxococcota bacterium]|nr:NFACT RNA binding domain-containing protein [Myxococcota bacterium]
MLSLKELRRAAHALQQMLAGHRLEKIVQYGDDRIVLSFHGRAPAPQAARARHHLLFCCTPGFARVSELKDPPPAPARPLAFAQYLRAHLDGSRFAGARILDNDRQLALALDTREGRRELLLSILGGRSNLYLLNGEGCVEAFLRPLEITMRGLVRGAPWRGPETPPPTEGADRFAPVRDEVFLVEIEQFYAERERALARETETRALQTALAREAAGVIRKRERLRAEMEAAGDPEDHLRRGQLLKGALHLARPGAASVAVRNPESGTEVTLELDPALSPVENLEQCFARYRKAKRRAAKLSGELTSLDLREANLAALQEALQVALASSASDAIAVFAAQPAVRPLLGRARPQSAPAPSMGERRAAKRREALPARLRPRCYLSADGLEIWVGRSDEGNDHLTTRLARGHDVFLHVEGGAGSHVILCTGGRTDAPQESLLDACELALHFSKQRGSPRAAIHLAPIKHVMKPRGAKPGLVHVRGGRELMLRHEPARLARILATRLDES